MYRNEMFDRLCAYSHELSEMNHLDELPTQVYVDKCRKFVYRAACSPYNDADFIRVFRECFYELGEMIHRSEGALK